MALVALGLAGAAQARVTRIAIARREITPAKPGMAPYVILQGHYEGTIDPADPRNAIITDIDGAPRNADGKVIYRATFALAFSASAARSSGFLIYDVPNRGNGAVFPDAEGHVRVISGWQGDIQPRLAAQYLEVPVAAGLTGPALQRFTNVTAGNGSVAIVGGIGQPNPRPLPVSLNTRKARLFTQAGDSAPARDIAAGGLLPNDKCEARKPADAGHECPAWN